MGKKKSNKLLFFLILIFIFLNFMDFLTTFFVKESDGNPIINFTGSVLLLFVVKLIICLIVISVYRNNTFRSSIWYYSFLSILIYGTFILFVAQLVNIYGILNPVVIQEGAKIPAQERSITYSLFITFFYILPLLFNLFTFYIYEKSKKFIKFLKK
jgi:hypothetical protein